MLESNAASEFLRLIEKLRPTGQLSDLPTHGPPVENQEFKSKLSAPTSFPTIDLSIAFSLCNSKLPWEGTNTDERDCSSLYNFTTVCVCVCACARVRALVSE